MADKLLWFRRVDGKKKRMSQTVADLANQQDFHWKGQNHKKPWTKTSAPKTKKASPKTKDVLEKTDPANTEGGDTEGQNQE